GRVGVEVLAVDVHPGGVQAVHHGLVEGGAAAAHGVEHARAAGDQVHGGVARHGGDVQQKLGEVLVRLAGVLLDRQQIAAEQVEGLERDRTQQVALELEQRVERRSEERRVGKECRCRWSQDQLKKIERDQEKKGHDTHDNRQ